MRYKGLARVDCARAGAVSVSSSSLNHDGSAVEMMDVSEISSRGIIEEGLIFQRFQESLG